MQTIDFCGVNAHHVNGLIKPRIRTLSTDTQTILLHVMHIWPEIIGTLLWPFALKAYENTLHMCNLDSGLKSPAMKFAKCESLPRVTVKYTVVLFTYSKIAFKLLEVRSQHGILGITSVSTLGILFVILVLSHLS